MTAQGTSGSENVLHVPLVHVHVPVRGTITRKRGKDDSTETRFTPYTYTPSLAHDRRSITTRQCLTPGWLCLTKTGMFF